jgi:hypothetical protein
MELDFLTTNQLCYRNTVQLVSHFPVGNNSYKQPIKIKINVHYQQVKY